MPKKHPKYYLQLKQSKKLVKPMQIKADEKEQVLAMKVEQIVKLLCDRLKEINRKLIVSIVCDLWDSTQEQVAKREAIVNVYNKVCGIQRLGGMENPQIGGFKTAGGVFVHLMKQEFPDVINLRQIKKTHQQQLKLMQGVENM